MGRPCTPTAVLDARGSFLKNPGRKRLNEPTTDRPLGDPPTHISHEQSAVWLDLADELLPGVGKRSDRTAFELLVRLVAKMRDGTQRMSEMTAMVSLLGQFAMTPSSRSKVAVEKPAESSLSAFLRNGISLTGRSPLVQ
jgi:hypothetical protein